MREILFRGKRKDNGRWVEGELRRGGVHSDSEVYIRFKDYRALFNLPVDPETVGQFTGLTDENGKKIFEGDVVKGVRDFSNVNFVGYVVWGNGCFDVQDVKTKSVPAIDLVRKLEVIGNIHDNPELLKEG